jgi:hypothetical protein
MNRKKILLETCFIFTTLCVLLASPVQAQNFCKGDFAYDADVDAEDVGTFLEHFGRSPFNNPCPSDGPAPVPKTGLDRCYTWEGNQIACTGTGQDGELKRGVAWPDPRFTDNVDGTVTDNLTGLIWLKNADCFGQKTWDEALIDCNGLASGACGLTDGSVAGNWRLPHVRELFSLIDFATFPVVLLNQFFSNVIQDDTSWWTSTNSISSKYNAYYVQISDATSVSSGGKTSSYHVWPVRGGR